MADTHTRVVGGVVMTYLTTLPTTIPAGHVVVHNHVRPTRHLGSRGFRAWLQPADPDRLTVCACGWAPELGSHFRVAGAGGGDA